MKLAKYRLGDGSAGVASWEDDRLTPLDISQGSTRSLTDILEAEDPVGAARSLAAGGVSIPAAEVQLLAPIDRQEVWAAGVTYKRSQTARMEESEAAASCYDRVYDSPRPELFLKATPHRVAGPGQPLRIRNDSKWNVPEPEFTLVLNSRMRIVGYTIGNDMSSRDIEGDNPLYLPQAKVYDACCGLGPCIVLAGDSPPGDQDAIELIIWRGGQIAFQGRTDLGQMARSFDDLVGYLGRDNSFPDGAFLLTGTGIVPPSDFTLLPADLVEISIDGIGKLANPVEQR